MRLSAADHDRVTAAVTAAERDTDGEIVTIVARRSDAYHDVALHWAVLAMLLVPALLACRPALAEPGRCARSIRWRRHREVAAGRRSRWCWSIAGCSWSCGCCSPGCRCGWR